MNDKGSKPVIICLGIIATFWSLMILGPFLVMLWNWVTVWFSGFGYLEGSFGYKILIFVAQPISCGLAHYAAQSISNEDHGICVLVNEIIAACIFVLLILSAVFLQSDILTALNNLTSSVVIIVCSVYTAKSLTIPA